MEAVVKKAETVRMPEIPAVAVAGNGKSPFKVLNSQSHFFTRYGRPPKGKDDK